MTVEVEEIQKAENGTDPLPPQEPVVKKKFDAKAMSKALKEKPKQYSNLKFDAKDQDFGKQDPPPGPGNSSTNNDQKPESDKEPAIGKEATNKSADAIMFMVEYGVKMGCSAFSGMPGDNYGMEASEKAEAARYLAQGLEEMGGDLKIPWWLPFSIVMIAVSLRNFKQAKADKLQAEIQRHDKLKDQEPDDLLRTVPIVPDQKPAPESAPVHIVEKITGPVRVCERPDCTEHLNKKQKHYCTRRCSMLHREAKKRSKKAA